MHGHGHTGRAFAGRIVQLITASTGLADWEWGVTLFADDPKAIKDVVYEMRYDEGSAIYAEFGPFTLGLLAPLAAGGQRRGARGRDEAARRLLAAAVAVALTVGGAAATAATTATATAPAAATPSRLRRRDDRAAPDSGDKLTVQRPRSSARSTGRSGSARRRRTTAIFVVEQHAGRIMVDRLRHAVPDPARARLDRQRAGPAGPRVPSRLRHERPLLRQLHQRRGQHARGRVPRRRQRRR